MVVMNWMIMDVNCVIIGNELGVSVRVVAVLQPGGKNRL